MNFVEGIVFLCVRRLLLIGCKLDVVVECGVDFHCVGICVEGWGLTFHCGDNTCVIRFIGTTII
jgi:hypothetical protein